MDDAFKGTDDAGDDLVEFTCPYNCGKPIRMKERNVIKNKCTDCRSHLLKCDAAAAADDEVDTSSFYICGAVDGVADALVVTAAEPDGGGGGEDGGGGDEADEWATERIVVEIKNRVGRISIPPPFYDELQTAAYCLMLGTRKADLVQCLRRPEGTQIGIHRIDVDAPPLSHAAAWEAHVVPRLHGFADAVRRYRNDGARRAAFLCAPPERRAAMLREDFPFLAH